MEFTKPTALAMLLLLLTELSMATSRSRSRPGGYGSDRKRIPDHRFMRPQRYPRPIHDHNFMFGGRKPFPLYPITKPKPTDASPVQTQETTPVTDPADLSNLFGRCSQDPDVNIKSIFSSMFLTPTDLDELVLESKAEMQPSAFSHYKKTERYIEVNRFQETIGTVQEMAAPGQTDGNTCCETRLVITAPGKVMEDGKSMSVVHMNHSYQYVQEGQCTQPSARCRDIGICTQIFKYAFLLLYDPQLVGRINPPVRYGRVQVKSHCECMNIGVPAK